jgi:UDP:flavonoid glycosyltransferase YjiC (YdhE family)
MARILVASIPVVGHLNPLVPIVRALCARGHEVAWYTGAKYRAKVEATGARWYGWTSARDYDDAALDRAFPGRTALSGLAKLKFDMKRVFIDNAPGQLADVQAIAAQVDPQVVLAEAGSSGALFHSEALRRPVRRARRYSPCAQQRRHGAVRPRPRTERDPAWKIAQSRAQLRGGESPVPRCAASLERHARARRIAADRMVAQRRRPGGRIPAADDPGARAPAQRSAPQRALHRHAARRCARALGAAGVLARARRRPPVVHVTQGTLANTAPRLIAPALRGLADEDVLVVVSTGGPSAQSLGLRDVPPNARIAPFLSYPALLPKTSVMVTNGGYGGVQMALAHGVPLVVAGTSEDKPEVATRVACASAGIDLRTATPTPEQVRRAVRRLLDEPHFRARAKALAADYARYDAVSLAVEAVESLVASAP